MKYLFTKMRRDILSMWSQFFSVFMMALIALTIYSGMEGVWYGLKSEVELYYEQTNLADGWITGNAISSNDIEKISSISDIEKVVPGMEVSTTIQNEDNANIQLITVQSTELFQPYIISGKEYEENLSNAIWIDQSFAEERGYKLGDTINLKYNDKEKVFQIEGLFLHSEFIYYTGQSGTTVPNHNEYGYALISPKSMESFLGQYFYNKIRIGCAENANYTKIQESVENILSDKYTSFFTREDLSSVSQITKEISQMQSMANLFSAVFILLAVLSMYTTMTRLVKTQVTQIGTLKAIGFSDWSIRLHYAIYSVFLPLFGGILGTVLGQLVVSRAVMRIKKTTLTLPEWKVQLSFFSYLLILFLIAICVAATIIATWQGVSKLPAETMRGNITRTKQHKYLVNKTIKNSEWTWFIRDIVQNKMRWIMCIIGVAGSMVLMIAGLGFKDSINLSNNYVYGKQYTYIYKMQIGLQREGLDRYIDSFDGNLTQLYENNAELYFDTEKDIRTITVFDNNKYIHFEKEHKGIQLTYGKVAISKKLAEDYNVKEGDTIRIRPIGMLEIYNIEITDIVDSPSPQGVFMSSDTWEKMSGEQFYPTALLSNTQGDLASDNDVIKETLTLDQQFSDMEKMTRSVMAIIYLLVIASIVLSVIMLYNLGTLNYIERYREYATLKVLGFYQKEIGMLILRDCILTTLLGWLIGIPIGFRFLEFYIGVVQFKSFQWIPYLTIFDFILASIIIISVSFLVNLWLAYKVTKINMVEALKDVE